MDWHCLGHAMWLAEASGLRLLFDPLLDDAHHGGVFRVFPGRTIDAAALRPDFVFVSHRHPDHFDPRSLRRLAELDPDSVLVTPDPLVGEIAELVGFRSVRLVGAETTIDLDGPRLVTTPSPHATDPEWGLLVATEDGVVWNQVDTSLGRADDVERFFETAALALARPRAKLVTLALARWQPLLEVAAFTAGDIGFPFEAYAAELEHVVAVDPAVVCPSAAGACHAAPFAASNALVYPLGEARFARDLKRRAPAIDIVENVVGATYRVRDGRVEVDTRGAIASGLVAGVQSDIADPRDYRPLAVPELVDPGARGEREVALVARIERWVNDELRPALDAQPPFARLLEVVLPSETRRYPFGGSADAWDLRCAVAGSLLVEVLDGRLHWGDLLLAGMLRGATRAYTIDAHGLRRAPEQPLFVYHALSYEESARRAAFSSARP
ncbi:MAG: MBL fold metallo-hydrolase [Labilithrix sp.]